MDHNSHISDHDLLLAAEGELSKKQNLRTQRHLDRCPDCLARMKNLQAASVDFARTYRESLDPRLNPSYRSRALFTARLSEVAKQHAPMTWWQSARNVSVRGRFAYAFWSCLLVIAGVIAWQSGTPSLALSPNPRLTPGATLPLTQTDVCTTRESAVRPRLVLPAVGKQVFAEYGIRNPQPYRYELDYLIDPDLGGSDDARNLWPQPYSAQWNAHVKDALEEHLRELVCAGTITLAQAQKDISVDWISAYKKYFNTDRPVPALLAYVKDQPWD
jgi:hypothetical protein